jgi:hypothetical protein
MDVECFWVSSRLWPKELCYIDVEKPLDLHYYMLKTELNWMDLSADDKKKNAYLINHYHCLQYNQGKASMNDINIESQSVILVNGAEKRSMVQSLFEHCRVFNVECSSLLRLPNNYKHICCPFSTNSLYHCACIKLYKFYSYYKQY